jgi:anthranilate phosphoribosyltransferase
MPAIPDAVDVVGTGGDRANTVNISTMAAIVVAGAGIPVVKHGNRAASSTCGSADVLVELGVRIDAGAEEVLRSVTEVGIGFCFAPNFHPGFRHAGAVRRELGVATVFNFLGPLSNPARPKAASVGCADPVMAPIVARVLAAHGVSGLVARGDDGLDELTTTAPTHIWVADHEEVTPTVIDAVEFGIDRAKPSDLTGGDAPFNARVVREVLAGTAGAARDAVVLNAGAAIAAYRGLTPQNLRAALQDGIAAAKGAIDSGTAHDVLERWIAFSAANQPR